MIYFCIFILFSLSFLLYFRFIIIIAFKLLLLFFVMLNMEIVSRADRKVDPQKTIPHYKSRRNFVVREQRGRKLLT